MHLTIVLHLEPGIIHCSNKILPKCLKFIHKIRPNFLPIQCYSLTLLSIHLSARDKLLHTRGWFKFFYQITFRYLVPPQETNAYTCKAQEVVIPIGLWPNIIWWSVCICQLNFEKHNAIYTSTCPAWKRSKAPSIYTMRASGPGPCIKQYGSKKRNN